MQGNLTDLLKWLETKPDLVDGLMQRMAQETEPKLEIAEPPHNRTIQYFWFDGVLYRREGFTYREENFWERYKEDSLGDVEPWWGWETVSAGLARKLENQYLLLFS